MIIETPSGSIEVSGPEATTMQELRKLLPYGITQFSEPLQNATYGFVMCCGDEEVWCLKQQPLEQDKRQLNCG